MDWKTAVSLISAGVAAFSAYTAWQAKEKAHELAKDKFEVETTLGILNSVYKEMAGLDLQSDSREMLDKRALACAYVTTLELAEKGLRTDGPLLVGDFTQAFKDAGVWDRNCDLRALENAAIALPVTSEEQVVVGDPQLPGSPTSPTVDDVGVWQALIASYQATQRGCDFATADVGEFAGLLGSEGLAGLTVRISRTRVSDHYAVSVDAGDDPVLAREASKAIRRVSGQSSDGRTGRDSFVQRSRDWYIDNDCPVSAEIEN